MPWIVEKRGSKWVVLNEQTRAVKGTHPSKAKAVAQQRALYANVPESRKK
jgi:hypothetical protein